MKVLEFQVMLGDKPVGSHRFQLEQGSDGAQLVKSEARFDVHLLGIPVYRYRHQATERWQSGCLLQMTAATQDGGKTHRVTGATRDGRFQIDGQAQPQSCPSSYAYWDLDRLRQAQALVNPQTGRVDVIRLEPRGQERLVVRGEPVMTNRHRLHAGELVIDLWHTPAGEWVQLESAVSPDRRLRYRLK